MALVSSSYPISSVAGEVPPRDLQTIHEKPFLPDCSSSPLFFYISWGSFQWEGGRLNTAGKPLSQSKTQSSTTKTPARPFPGLNLGGTLELVCQLSQPDVQSFHKNFVLRHQLSSEPDTEATLRLFPVTQFLQSSSIQSANLGKTYHIPDPGLALRVENN